MVRRITCLGGWSVPPTSVGRAAAGGGGGATAGVLSGMQSFSKVAGSGPELRSQTGARLHAPQKEVVFWVDC